MTTPAKSDDERHLRKFTPARVGLGRTGHSLPTRQLLEFNLDHARARDAVYSAFDFQHTESQLKDLGLPFLSLHSRAADRREYLLRPDLGRQLHQDSHSRLQEVPTEENELCIVLADGLSAVAVNTHALEVVKAILNLVRPKGWRLAPIALVEQGRVAVADEIGESLHSEMSLILIGERPGLTSPHSLGAYVTYRPRTGLTDERRNCVSNIRPDGLTYALAADKIVYLLSEMKKHQLSGVSLKDNFGGQVLE